MNIGPRLTETVSRKTVESRSEYADPVYSEVDTFAARIERGGGITYDSSGMSIQYAYRMFCMTVLAPSDLVFFAENDTADNNTGRRFSNTQACFALDGSLSHFEYLF